MHTTGMAGEGRARRRLRHHGCGAGLRIRYPEHSEARRRRSLERTPDTRGRIGIGVIVVFVWGIVASMSAFIFRTKYPEDVMKSVAGVFVNRDDAVRAINQLVTMGVESKQINFLTPDHPDAQLNAVPTTEGEQPGMGPALGAVVGGASGAAAGLGLVSLLVPGVGAVAGLGLAAMALFGAGGALAGAAVGDKVESTLDDGLPRDEIFVYEDALRRGRSVVIVLASDDMEESVRTVLESDGAESVDDAREQWWLGIRDAEEQRYTSAGGDFASDEPVYRRGFESSLHHDYRGRSFDDVQAGLAEKHPECVGDECFQEGFQRGEVYRRKLLENQDDDRV